MIYSNTVIWGNDESFTSSQMVERDGRQYLRRAVHDAAGNVVSETLTPAEDVQATSIMPLADWTGHWHSNPKRNPLL